MTAPRSINSREINISKWNREQLRREHRPRTIGDRGYESQFSDDDCVRCWESWPCTTIRMIDMLDKLDAEQAHADLDTR